MPYVGTIKERILIRVKLVRELKWSQPSWGGGTDLWTKYIMEDDGGNIFCWKTTSVLALEETCVREGGKITIKATVKAHTEFNGQKQTELNRVKVLSIEKNGKTKEEKKAEKKAKQMESLKKGDCVIEMLYSQFKMHYADCETVIGSFNNYDGEMPARVSVIVREGRLKPSGVRYQKFHWFEIEEGGYKYRYRAISEKNAQKQHKKAMKSKGENTEREKIKDKIG